jgi:branched-chain amino acid transport system substrate-binding protein
VVLFTGYYPEAGLLMRQKMEMGWNVPFLGGDATNNPDLVKIAGKQAAEGYYFLSPPVPQDLDSKAAKDFMSAFKQKYNAEPGSVWAVLAGDGFNVLAAAIKGSGSTDTEKMVAYLKTQLKDMPGLTGNISFDEKGDRVGDLYRVYRVDADGKFVLQP